MEGNILIVRNGFWWYGGFRSTYWNCSIAGPVSTVSSIYDDNHVV